MRLTRSWRHFRPTHCAYHGLARHAPPSKTQAVVDELNPFRGSSTTKTDFIAFVQMPFAILDPDIYIPTRPRACWPPWGFLSALAITMYIPLDATLCVGTSSEPLTRATLAYLVGVNMKVSWQMLESISFPSSSAASDFFTYTAHGDRFLHLATFDLPL